MAIVLTDNRYYSEIANAIRTQNGTSDKYTPAQMAEAILALSVIKTIPIDTSNIDRYFTVSNYSYYFVGSGNVFTTNNIGVDSSTARTTLTALYDMTISFDYSYASESGYDKFSLAVGNTSVASGVSGVGTNQYSGTITKGTVITFTYTKDGSASANGDKCTFSNMVVTGAF